MKLKADQHVIPEQKNNLGKLPSCDQDLLIALVKLARQLALFAGIARVRTRTLDLLLATP